MRGGEGLARVTRASCSENTCSPIRSDDYGVGVGRTGVGEKIESGVLVGIGVMLGTGVKLGIDVKAGVGVMPGVAVAAGVPVTPGVGVVPTGVNVGVVMLVGRAVGPDGVEVGLPDGTIGVTTVGVPPGPIGVGVGPDEIGVGVASGPVTEFSLHAAGAKTTVKAARSSTSAIRMRAVFLVPICSIVLPG